MRHALSTCLRSGAQFVLLGRTSDAAIEREFDELKRNSAGNVDCHLDLTFNDELAHLIYAGAEFILIPSQFEPCGLTQMIALKYGTVPIVRETGGLAETVFDANYSGKGFHEVNGYTFKDLDGAGVDSALLRAIGLWHQHPEYFRKLQLNGMRYDYSWNKPADEYLHVYERALAR
jgi:starch synthase